MPQADDDSTIFSRREVLKSTARMGAAAALAGAMVTASDDAEILAIAERIKQLVAAANKSGLTDEQRDEIMAGVYPRERRLAQLPARTLQGLAAKFRVYDIGHGPDEEDAERYAVIGVLRSALLDAERLSVEARS